MPQPRSLAKKLLLALLGVVALVVVLVGAVLVLLDSDAVAKRAVDLVLPRVSAALGREVKLRQARLDLFPDTRVELLGFSVAGRPGEPDLVELEALRLELGLWPLVRSLGKDLQVNEIVLVRPTIALVKGKDGTWSFEGLGGPAAAEPAPAPAPSAPGATPAFAVHTFRIEKAAIRVVDRTQGADDAGLALSELDLEAHGVGPGLPLDATLAAALASKTQNLHATLSISKLPAAVPARAEDWPLVQGSLSIGPLALERFRALFPADLAALVRGGVAKLDAKLTTREDRTFRVEGDGQLTDLRLRGQAASGRFRATASWNPGRPAYARVDLTDLAVRGPGVDLGGNASVETEPMRAWFVLTGALLDLDALMGVLPETEPAPPLAPGEDLVPASTRAQLRDTALRGQVAIQEVRSGGLTLTDVVGKVSLAGGVMTLDELRAALFGGRVEASGTKVDLGKREPTWTLAARLTGLDLKQALAAFSPGKPSPLEGKLDGTVGVSGAGIDWAAMRDRLDGATALSMKEGALVTTDLGDQVLGGLSQALSAVGKGGAAEKVAGAQGGRTTWKDLAGDFAITQGALVAKQPVAFQTGFGGVSLGGKLGLDGALGLTGEVSVPKAALGARVNTLALPATLPATLVVPVGVGGTLTSPSVDVQAGKALGGLVKGQVDALKTAATEKAKAEAAKLAEQADARAKEEAAKARARAEEEAAKAKQKAEEAGKRALGGALDKLRQKK